MNEDSLLIEKIYLVLQLMGGNNITYSQSIDIGKLLRNTTLEELVEKIGYNPQQHNFYYIDGTIMKYNNITLLDEKIEIYDLIKCKDFIKHIKIYLIDKYPFIWKK